jgi:ubiquinone/menaquinone biosynthesis C-methylase UbiE
MMKTYSDDALVETLGRHIAMYRWRRPTYQVVMLGSLMEVWDPSCRRVLDLGGGTGVIAQAIQDHFPVDRVVSIDLHERFLKTLTVETMAYDGAHAPFADGSFDCGLFNNVIHHIPKAARTAVLSECARVNGRGPIFIKDHIAQSALDHLRLAALDFMGNVPFSGMVEAAYLTMPEWEALAGSIGYRIERKVADTYREGLTGLVFPNRLEITMKWVSTAS